MNLNESQVAELVSRVVERLKEKGVTAPAASPVAPAANDCWTRRRHIPENEPIKRKFPAASRQETPPPVPATPAANPKSKIENPKSGDGLFEDVDSAANAAHRAQEELA